MDLDDLLDEVRVQQPSPAKEPQQKSGNNEEWGDLSTNKQNNGPPPQVPNQQNAGQIFSNLQADDEWGDLNVNAQQPKIPMNEEMKYDT